MKLSILIPSIPSRFDRVQKLYNKCLEQATDEVEIIMFMDNKKRTIGKKRNDLISLVNGKFFMILDDDDDISDDFISSILPLTDDLVDVITFKQQCNMDGYSFEVTFGVGNEVESNSESGKYTDCKRPPWHCCVWLTERVKIVKFPDISYGEDGVWAERASWITTSSKHVDKILHYYNFNEQVSEADSRTNEHWSNPN